jgi:Arc/MetJ-type ribon-helix-helix transcriptional regulator
MAGRLTLSTVGIKSPLDIGAADVEPEVVRTQPDKQPSSRPRRAKAARARASHSAGAPAAGSQHDGGEAPFYGCGRPLQTSVSLDADCARLVEELARAAHVAVSALVVAAMQAGLPAQSDEARMAIVDERVSRAGAVPARVERNFRLPEQLRARVDELVAAAREHLPRVNRADLVNAALRRGLPTDAQQAADLVSEHARRRERAAAA